MKIIKINTDHYVVVDDSEIKEGDWLLDTTDNTVWDCHKDMPNSLFPECKKITHSTQPLDERNGGLDFIVQGILELSLKEIKELIGEVDINEKAYKYAVDYRCPATNDEEYCKHDIVSAYNNGYNQAIEDNEEKKYTEAQMRECWRASERFDRPYHEGYAPNFEEFIQSLQPKTEWEVEIVDGKLKLK